MLPLISCIMPTRNRRRFIEQAIKYFQSQDYDKKELIIIDDGEDTIADLLPRVNTIRSVYVSEPCSIGMKRNLAISLAQGEIICHFDDDDYYGSERLSRQVAPLLSGKADITALRMSLLFDLRDGTLWTCSDDTHRLCFKQDVHYGTLMYKRSYWQQGIVFASTNVGEDRRFVHALLAQDRQLARLVHPASFAYVLHGDNSTSDMRLVHRNGWQKVLIEHYFSEEDQAFYQQFVAGRKKKLCSK